MFSGEMVYRPTFPRSGVTVPENGTAVYSTGIVAKYSKSSLTSPVPVKAIDAPPTVPCPTKSNSEPVLPKVL